jgi:hypothetical protein
MRSFLTFILVLATGPALGDEPKARQGRRPQVPGDARIFEQDMAGAYFIERPLMEKYEGLKKRAAALRADINAGKINGATARATVAALQTELSALLKTIDTSKFYAPGATVYKRSETIHIPLRPDDLLLVDADSVEIRGWDGPEVKCVIEKVVLDDDSGKVDEDFAGIEIVSRKGSGKEFFGFYTDIKDRPELKANADMQRELRRFVFPEFLGREFPYITVKGLAYDGGNRQINVSVGSESGDGFSASQWRRHATLTLFVPKCQRVGVRGGLERFEVRDLNADLAVLGQGNRDYNALYEVTNLVGSFTAENFPIQRIDGIKGNVSVTATAYIENKGTEHGPSGVTARAYEPKESLYRDIDGDLRVRFCRANLTIGDVGGRVDVENDFGDTIWQTDRELAQKADHRVVSQSGTIAVRHGTKVPGALKFEMFTECGTLRRAGDVEKALNARFEETIRQTADGDTARRSWISWTRRPSPEATRPPHDPEESFARFRRVADALYGRPRSPGIDVISRSGTITIAAPDRGPVSEK